MTKILRQGKSNSFPINLMSSHESLKTEDGLGGEGEGNVDEWKWFHTTLQPLVLSSFWKIKQFLFVSLTLVICRLGRIHWSTVTATIDGLTPRLWTLVAVRVSSRSPSFSYKILNYIVINDISESHLFCHQKYLEKICILIVYYMYSITVNYMM